MSKSGMHKSRTEPKGFQYHRFKESGPNSVGAKFHEEKVTEREKNWFSPRHNNSARSAHFPPSPSMNKKVIGAGTAEVSAEVRRDTQREFNRSDQHRYRGGAQFPPQSQLQQVPFVSYSHTVPSVQIPYNVTKGAYEIWPSVPYHQQQADVMYQVFEGFLPYDARTDYASLPMVSVPSVTIYSSALGCLWKVSNI